MSNRYSDDELAGLLLSENGLPPTDNALEVIKAVVQVIDETDAWHGESNLSGSGPTVKQYAQAVVNYLEEWT